MDQPSYNTLVQIRLEELQHRLDKLSFSNLDHLDSNEMMRVVGHLNDATRHLNSVLVAAIKPLDYQKLINK